MELVLLHWLSWHRIWLVWGSCELDWSYSQFRAGPLGVFSWLYEYFKETWGASKSVLNCCMTQKHSGWSLCLCTLTNVPVIRVRLHVCSEGLPLLVRQRAGRSFPLSPRLAAWQDVGWRVRQNQRKRLKLRKIDFNSVMTMRWSLFLLLSIRDALFEQLKCQATYLWNVNPTKEKTEWLFSSWKKKVTKASKW